MNITLRVWRQANAKAEGRMVTYQVQGVSHDMSFLEMLDLLNEDLTLKGEEPVATTAERAWTRANTLPSFPVTSSLPGDRNLARPWSLWSSGMRSTLSMTKPTKRSRSPRTRSMTARPSTSTVAWTPNGSA